MNNLQFNDAGQRALANSGFFQHSKGTPGSGSAIPVSSEILDDQDLYSGLYTLGSFDLYTMISRAPATAGGSDAKQAIVRTIASFRLEKSIRDERLRAEIDGDAKATADQATTDAIQIVRRENLAGNPNLYFSEDGFLSLQWKNGDLGAALIFSGDAKVSIAIRKPGLFYSDNGTEIDVTENLSANFKTMLALVVA
jgi:hypothetical protein